MRSPWPSHSPATRPQGAVRQNTLSRDAGSGRRTTRDGQRRLCRPPAISIRWPTSPSRETNQPPAPRQPSARPAEFLATPSRAPSADDRLSPCQQARPGASAPLHQDAGRPNSGRAIVPRLAEMRPESRRCEKHRPHAVQFLCFPSSCRDGYSPSHRRSSCPVRTKDI